ncbi:MAG: two-component regulator propeller domain-containing protein, partial [bacterium]|nr:two-component regulator propeller domain-containing protein [bacterium]
MRIFFLCLCFLSVAGIGQAQRFQSPQWQVRAFHAPEELGYEEVHDLQKARDGSVWLATDGGGVTRLQNGQSTVYNRSQGLISNSCRGVLEDAWGGIWVGTNQGISYINKGTISNFTSKTFAFLQNDAIVSIAIDSQDRIWFANEANQIFYFTPTTLVQNEPQGLWSLYPYSGKPGSRIEALSFNSQGHLWVVLDYGGVELFTKQGEYFHYNVNGNAKLNVPCSAILLTADDSLWICGAGQLRCLADGQLQKRIPTPYSLTALGEYQGTILVGTADHGLFYLEGEQLLPIPLGNDQPLTHIECIRSYGDEVIWIGSHEGAYRISPSPWQMLPDLTPGVLLQPQTLTRTADGSLYILDQKATLYKFDYNGWEKQVTLPIKKEGDEYRFAVHSMIAKQNEALFLLADQECFEISLPPPIVVRPLPLPQDYQAEPHCGLFLSSQSELWLAYTQGIARWNGVRWEPFPLGKEHANPQVFWIHEIEPGWYWFLGSGWIEENRNGVIQSVSLPQTYTDFTDEASKLFCAVNHRNAVWIATDRNGILRFDGSGWQHFHHRDGLPNEGIRSLYSAPDGVLWIGSNHNGVGSFQDGRWIVYRYNEGLPNGVVDRISQDPFGTIWAEIRYEGIACYRPSKRRPVVWMEMESSSLLPGESGVFSFDGRDHWNETEQEDLVFSWRILDRINHRITADWSPYSHARIVNTPRLQPGQYQFQVRVQDTDRRTSLAPVTSDFTVMPYFWSTPAFWVPVLVAIAAIFSSLWIWFRKHRALLHSEEQYRHLGEKDTRTLMVNWDGEGRIIYCNECFEKLVGV